MTPQQLDQTFGALADGTRRAIVARLSEHESLPVSAIAEPFEMSLPAVMKHLGVLERAGMISDCTISSFHERERGRSHATSLSCLSLSHPSR